MSNIAKVKQIDSTLADQLVGNFSLRGSGFIKQLSLANSLKGKIPAGIYMFKINNRNTVTRSEICSKLTIKIVE